MGKISREDNKKRYKTGMYPTQQDFENAFDSYVHKDDTIDPSKIVSGNENIVDIINRKAEEKHSHEIKEVDGLQTFIDEMTNLLEIVRDSETGEISQSKLKTLTDGIAALRDDIDTNADNVAGHEFRIQTNEAALEKVYQILGKDAKESIDDLANRFAALSGNYANVYAFINKVKQFLEDADASDETINRWQEIESFLQGITDTETLTGLLEQQRTDLEGRIAEAIAAIPKGNYLKQISDLDGYTEAQDGEIVQYVGQTNDNYTRGYIYERKAGDAVSLPAHTSRLHIVNLELKDGVEEDLNGWYVPTDDTLTYCLPNTMNTGGRVYGLPLNANSQYVTQSQGLKTLGEVIRESSSGYTEFASGQGFTAAEMQRLNDETKYLQSTIWENVQTGKKIIMWSTYNMSPYNLVSTSSYDTILATDGAVITGVYSGISSSGDEQNTIWKDPEDTIEIGSSPASWQLCPSMPVIQ